ncbi:hypothetical protein F8280_27610 [Micromonospora noduli]|uniref:hypothetical protein n=1 Tax=Micromonospora noduli TaxID=709876 RepID=UPI000DC5121B|nr:hypothetical protein [Micromonospora noduli]KAB1918893.1 hypothetical protein F8280_27610 [Micromonospora noduli]RAO30120.1 hypothetical protein ONO86_05673 [Micromonospora noduli]
MTGIPDIPVRLVDRPRCAGHPGVAGIPIAADQMRRQAAPAEPWYAVSIRGYGVVGHPAQPGIPAASWQRIPPLRIRPLTARA